MAARRARAKAERPSRVNAGSATRSGTERPNAPSTRERRQSTIWMWGALRVRRSLPRSRRAT
eukprot:5382115-Alexandrium_andersonii.AAC.1